MPFNTRSFASSLLTVNSHHFCTHTDNVDDDDGEVFFLTDRGGFLMRVEKRVSERKKGRKSLFFCKAKNGHFEIYAEHVSVSGLQEVSRRSIFNDFLKFSAGIRSHTLSRFDLSMNH